MKRLSKDQKQQRADLVTRLNDAAEAVRAALAAVNAEIAGKLNSAIENYNLVVSVVEEDIRPGCLGQSAIAAGAGTSGVLLLNDLDVRSGARELAQIAPRTVS